ncbi:MAG: PAS domain S-box protein [Acidobacteriaceae bacterium]|nr:PAS domain S-box protein [Acidobacteriaceae bacterium]
MSLPDTVTRVNEADVLSAAGRSAVPAHASVDDLRGRIAGLETLVNALQERVSSYERVFADYERVFTDNAVPAIVYATGSLAILEANESALALYGYDLDRIRSLAVLDLFAPQTLRASPNLEDELGKPANLIAPLAHRGAAKQELIVSLVVFPFNLHGIEARIAMIRDETARIATEEALRSSEERYRELFENANDVIFLHDLNGKILALNRAAEYITGYSRTELLGENFEGLVAPEARSQTIDSIRAHLGGSASQHYELPIVSKFGTLRFLDVSTRIIYRKGHPVAIQGIGRDITDRKHAQQRLLEFAQELQNKNLELSTALRLAQEATQLKEQFLANTSHELRTPMNGIMGMIDLLKTTELTADQREYADAVNQCANDLLTIINDLLDLSQIEAGRLSLRNEAFDCHESLKSVIKLLRLRAEGKDLELLYEIDPRLPALISGDSVRFRQVLVNLIANAIKFTPVGQVKVRLKFGDDRSTLRCEVVDSGIGVEESMKARIFEAFIQADGTTRRRFGGTGLGLTISKQLVEIMGGHIGTYNNSPGQGATFWFELPFQSAESPHSETTAASLYTDRA